MNDRSVPFDADEECDICKSPGSFDFMGDKFCQNCLDRFADEYYNKESD